MSETWSRIAAGFGAGSETAAAGTQPATFWKRDLYIQAGGMTPSFRFAFDTDLFFRFALRNARFKHVNQFVASFRIHSQSKSTNDLEGS